MFGRQGGLSGTSGGTGAALIEFRAGRMNMVDKMVHPDVRKGLVYMHQSDDGLMHFCWKDRVSGKVEDDLIVFPDDFEFKRVEQCQTGRVYVLKFKTSSRRMFFWMQEPKTDKDEEFCRRVNELLNNPPSATRESGDLQYMLNNMSQQQLMQLFGGVGQMGGLSSLLGSMNRSSENSSGRTSNTPTSNRLSSGGGLLTPENTSGSGPRTPSAPKANKNKGGSKKSSDSTGGQASRIINIDLSTAIASSDAVNQIVSDPDRVKTLSLHLPETDDSDESKLEQIKDTLTSPQFQQALSLFSNALQSAQLGPVAAQFELSLEAVAAAYAGDLEQFVKALDKSKPKSEEKDQSADKSE